MSQLVESSPAVMTAYRELQRFSEDAEMREMERRRRRFREDWQISITGAKDAGIIQGKAERDIEIARSMKQAGSGVDFIAQITGLPHAEIERLG